MVGISHDAGSEQWMRVGFIINIFVNITQFVTLQILFFWISTAKFWISVFPQFFYKLINIKNNPCETFVAVGMITYNSRYN